MKKTIRIANGQGFWGDSVHAPLDLLKYGKLDFLTLDYLAEVTMSIMQKQKRKNPNLGYASDFIQLIKDGISYIEESNIKVISNAGGANPESCREEISKILKQNSSNKKVGIISGDDILHKVEKFYNKGYNLNHLDTNEEFSSIKDRIVSANVYINSFSIATALAKGADIILAGRVSDPGLVLGPCINHFNWSENDFDKLASGTVAGHIIECGAQCSGGNYSRWHEIKDLVDIGYPIVEMSESGDFVVFKDENKGGLINKLTVSEQLLYEMGDPQNYISPDVKVDFTSLNLVQKEKNIVRVSNVKGFSPTDTYKVSICYFDGYKAEGSLTISGPNAKEKSKLASDLVWGRLKKRGIEFKRKKTDFIGLSACSGGVDGENKTANEIVLKLSVHDASKRKVEMFGKEIAPLITAGPPGVTGFSGGRPKPKEVIAYWPTLIPKDLIKIKVDVR